MTTFEKLEIAGIRSVDPDKPIEIDFFKPLTLITGPNGAGKTTLIESLRYACTGIFPPNSKNGQLFVRDPTISATKKTDAFVNLTLQTPKGPIQISRKLEVSSNAGKLKLTTKATKIELNGKKEDEKESVLSETIETSQEMLQSVLFCHQEDASWPFDEGKKLKEKFDEIFGTSNYTKFLDDITKVQKDYKLRQKDTQIAFTEVSASYKQFKDIEDKIVKCENQIKTKEEEKKIKTQNHEEKAKKIEQLRIEYDDLIKAKNRFDNLKNKLKEEEDFISQSKRNPKNTRDELEKLIFNLNVEIENLKSQNTDVLKKEDLEIKVQKLNDEIQQLTKEKAVIEKEIKDRCEIEKEIDETIEGKDSSEDKMKRIIGDIEGKKKGIEEEQKKDSALIENKRKEIREIESENENINNKYQMISKNLASKKLEVEKKTQLLIETQKQILEKKNYLKMAVDQLESLKQKLKNIAFDKNEIQIKSEINEIKENIGKIDLEIKKAIENVQQQVKFKQLTDEFERNEIKINEIKALVGNDLKSKNVELKENIQMLKKGLTDLKNENEDIKKQLMRSDLRKNQCTKELGDVDRQIFIKTKEINDLGLKEENDKRIIELKEIERGIWTAAEQLVNKAQEKGLCPVCGNQHIDEHLLQERKSEIKKMGKFSEEQRKELHALEDKEGRRGMIIKTLEENKKRKESLEIEGNELEKQIEKLEKQKEENQMKSDTKEAELSKLECLKDKVEDMCSREEENQRKKKELEKLKGLEKTRGVDELNKEKDAKNIDLKKKEEEYEMLRKERDEENKKKREIEMKEHDIMSEQRIIDEKEKTEKSNEEELNDGKIKIDEMNNELILIQQQLTQKQNEFTSKKHQLETLEHDIRLKETQRKKEMEIIQTKVNKINIWVNSLKKMKAKTDLEKNLFEINERLRANSFEHQSYSQKLEELKRSSGDVQDKMNSRIIQIASYEEDKKIIEKRESIESIKNLLETPNFKECELKLKKVSKDINQFTKEKDGVWAGISSIDGELKILSQNLDKLNEEKENLNQDGDLENRYDELSIKQIVEKNTIEDLDKYKGAVGRAMMKYHGEKMKEINETINELWSGVYAAQDIQTVKIVAEDVKIETTRTSYNYRVVMVKDNTEMDMRGRCSMGQKALASVIIRIALAKTFCSKCPVLALDEPTINLDEDNCSSLAQQLCKLLHDDGKLSHFQIILITHDENFVRKLSDFNEEYYRIERDPNNCSCIKRALFSSLV